MKNMIQAALVLMMLVSCETEQELKPLARHVVVIGVDGMSPDGIARAETPNLDYFIENGASTMTARAVLPTSSSPNWASMIMGAGPEQHGITSNGWERENDPMPPAVTGVENIFPSIFSVLKVQRPEAKSAVIYHWGGFGRLFEKSAVSFSQHGEDQFITTRVAADQIKNDQPELTFIHLDHVDHAGHEYGHGTDHYYTSVEEADSLIGVIREAVEEAGMLDETVFLITSDHGGLNYGHGGESLAEIQIPFILSGTGIKKNYEIPERVYTYDNAATVAYLLGLGRPQAWIGRPVFSALEGNEYNDPFTFEPPEMAKVAAPEIQPRAQLLWPAGGLFEQELPPVIIEHQNPEAVIYYTTDGTTPTTSSPVYEEPVTITESTIVRALAVLEGEQSEMESAYYRFVANQQPTISSKVYELDEVDNLPSLNSLQPVKSQQVYEFTLEPEWQTSSNLAVKMESKFNVKEPGTYHFFLSSDDGSKLYVNDQLVVDNDGQHGVLERTGEVTLEAGAHPMAVEYFNAGGRGWLEVLVKTPGSDEKQWIMPEMLSGE